MKDTHTHILGSKHGNGLAMLENPPGAEGSPTHTHTPPSARSPTQDLRPPQYSIPWETKKPDDEKKWLCVCVCLFVCLVFLFRATFFVPQKKRRKDPLPHRSRPISVPFSGTTKTKKAVPKKREMIVLFSFLFFFSPKNKKKKQKRKACNVCRKGIHMYPKNVYTQRVK